MRTGHCCPVRMRYRANCFLNSIYIKNPKMVCCTWMVPLICKVSGCAYLVLAPARGLQDALRGKCSGGLFPRIAIAPVGGPLGGGCACRFLRCMGLFIALVRDFYREKAELRYNKNHKARQAYPGMKSFRAPNASLSRSCTIATGHPAG